MTSWQQTILATAVSGAAALAASCSEMGDAVLAAL